MTGISVTAKVTDSTGASATSVASATINDSGLVGSPPYWGFAIGAYPNIPGDTMQAAGQRHVTSIGKPAVYRSYTSGGWPASWAATSQALLSWNAPDGTVWNASKRHSIHSFKPNIASAANGSLNASWKAYLATCPQVAGKLYMFPMWHEPEDEIKANTFTASIFKQAQIQLGRATQEYKATSGRSDILFIPVLMSKDNLAVDNQIMAATIPAGTGWPTALTAAQANALFLDAIDGVGMDPYQRGTFAPNSPPFSAADLDPATQFDPVWNWMEANLPGKYMIFAETGLRPDPASPNMRATWMANVDSWCAAPARQGRILAISYWDHSIANKNWVQQRETVWDSGVYVDDPESKAGLRARYLAHPSGL